MVSGVDWSDEMRWVLIGRISQNKFYIIDLDVSNDIDTMQHIDKLKLIISRESPKWVLCDAGYGKTENHMLMCAYLRKV